MQITTPATGLSILIHYAEKVMEYVRLISVVVIGSCLVEMEGKKMFEKEICGRCEHFYRFYCPLRNIQVSYSGKICPQFKRKGEIR